MNKPFNKRTNFPKFKQPVRKPKTVSLIDEKRDWNGTMFPFKGTKQLEEDDIQEAVEEVYDDDEWSASTSKGTIKLNNALGALMGAYGSDDYSEDETSGHRLTTTSEQQKGVVQTETSVVCVTEQTAASVSNVTEHAEASRFHGIGRTTSLSNDLKQGISDAFCDMKQMSVDSSGLGVQETRVHGDLSDDDSPPMEVKVARVGTPVGSEENLTTVQRGTRDKNLPKRRRQRHRNRHDNLKKNRPQQQQLSINSTKKLNEFPYRFKRRKVTLLEKLLENEIRQERNIMLQCVRYIVSNNFFIKDKTSVVEEV